VNRTKISQTEHLKHHNFSTNHIYKPLGKYITYIKNILRLPNIVTFLFIYLFYYFFHDLKIKESLLFTGGPHRRTQSDVPDFGDVEAHGDPFSDLSDGLPQKYATLPRNHNPNPFQGEAPALDRGGGPGGGEKREKKEKVSLLERVTGKKDARGKAANGARTASASDLCVPNPFGGEARITNPFSSAYKTRYLTLNP